MKKTFILLPLLLALQPLAAQQKVILPEGTPSAFVRHTAYDVSFNTETLTPNYVAYRLRPDDITKEGVSRSGEEFLPDPEIPCCPQSRDYSRRNQPPGYNLQRGHMMPAADNKTSAVRMRESFYLSNVCPQDGTLNEKDWADLEKQVRFWCKHYYKTDLWVICGPVAGKDNTATGINIPSGFWKVVCRRDTRDHKWKAIGFLFANNATSQPYADAVMSVDTIEKLTGLDFFSELDDKEEEAMEKDSSGWKM